MNSNPIINETRKPLSTNLGEVLDAAIRDAEAAAFATTAPTASEREPSARTDGVAVQQAQELMAA